MDQAAEIDHLDELHDAAAWAPSFERKDTDRRAISAREFVHLRGSTATVILVGEPTMPAVLDAFVCTIKQVYETTTWWMLMVSQAGTGRVVFVAWHPLSTEHFVSPILGDPGKLEWSECRVCIHNKRDVVASMYADTWLRQLEAQR
jgi:hypothetical protein